MRIIISHNWILKNTIAVKYNEAAAWGFLIHLFIFILYDVKGEEHAHINIIYTKEFNMVRMRVPSPGFNLNAQLYGLMFKGVQL